jgi:predicted nucleic acid-binding protein
VKVLVDTSVWSLVLRRPATDSSHGRELGLLIDEGRASLIGAVRQEVLSGVKAPEQFEKLRERLGAFPDVEVATEDYETAARFCNRCRRKGIQGSNTDFLICAVSVRHKMPVLSTDENFARYATLLPVIRQSLR